MRLKGKALREKLHGQGLPECLAYTLLFSLTPLMVICIFDKDCPRGVIPCVAGWGGASPGKKDHSGSFGKEIVCKEIMGPDL